MRRTIPHLLAHSRATPVHVCSRAIDQRSAPTFFEGFTDRGCHIPFDATSTMLRAKELNPTTPARAKEPTIYVNAPRESKWTLFMIVAAGIIWPLVVTPLLLPVVLKL